MTITKVYRTYDGRHLSLVESVRVTHAMNTRRKARTVAHMLQARRNSERLAMAGSIGIMALVALVAIVTL